MCASENSVLWRCYGGATRILKKHGYFNFAYRVQRVHAEVLGAFSKNLKESENCSVSVSAPESLLFKSLVFHVNRYIRFMIHDCLPCSFCWDNVLQYLTWLLYFLNKNELKENKEKSDKLASVFNGQSSYDTYRFPIFEMFLAKTILDTRNFF